MSLPGLLASSYDYDGTGGASKMGVGLLSFTDRPMASLVLSRPVDPSVDQTAFVAQKQQMLSSWGHQSW